MTSFISAKPALHVFRSFLTKEEIKDWHYALTEDSFWQDETFLPGMINYKKPLIEDARYQEKEKNLVEKICAVLESLYGFSLVTSNAPAFRKWTVGGFQAPHLDHGDFDNYENAIVDYSTLGGTTWPRCLNEYASILYWNDDYEGGELYFENPKISIRPEAGMLVCFPCSEQYAHGVTEITSGERIISTHFWAKAQTAATLLMAPDIRRHVHRRFYEKIKNLVSDDVWSDLG